MARVRTWSRGGSGADQVTGHSVAAERGPTNLPRVVLGLPLTLLGCRGRLVALLPLRRQLLLLLGLARPQGLRIHGVEQNHGGDACDEQRPEWREPQQQGGSGQQADVEAAEQVGDKARRERTGLAGDHGRTEVHTFGLGPADQPQPSGRTTSRSGMEG